MPFHPHIEAVLQQHLRNPLDLISCTRHELCFPAVEESQLMKADHEALRGHAQHHLLAFDLLAQRLVELPLQFDHVNARICGYCARPRLAGAGWTQYARIISRAIAAGKGSHLLKSILHSLGYTLNRLLVMMRGSEQHHKQSEQKGHEICIGHQPALVIRMLLASSAASHLFTSFATLAAAAGLPR